MCKKKLGFTLVELMVTIAVAAILLTIGVPSMISLYEGIRANTEIESIQESISFARNQAVSYGNTVSICPLSGSSCGNDWSKGFKVFIDNGTLGTLDSTNGRTDKVIKVVDGFNDKDYVEYDKSSISFNAEGLIVGSLGTGKIIYCPGSKTSTQSKGIQISSSGRVQSLATTANCN
ncbi:MULTISPECIES: GspH/FimT family pseudopilin [Shewanella]|uniref:GspH/FimT family pseudopilin n=1 Tax=Shewanella TaxID=22 RepID=UPI000D3AE6B8|nr:MULTISPECIES: GspH/FimT family pseudopilin [Shewanella]MCI2962604.1 GspH/FimT family pseudopilin [Shewanella sp. N2AIL]MDT3296196.1 GspH/FimT family pseudopilin [Shewanella sp. SP2S2-6]MDT3318548.1 GspH/FimT family pseudopilin [Shewanella sp. SP1S2-4]MDT3337395.1 GspH/FimT family pseudopilin [Shewanella sp. SP1S1-7]